jgi:DNA repair protein SbcD/Mre11
MKLLHTSDWHLGKKLGPYSRLEEQKLILEEILSIKEREQPDLIILSGDLYDTWNPPHEAIELLYKTLKNLSGEGKTPVIALAGNHDAPDHIEAPDPLARECGIFFLGYPESRPGDITLPGGLEVRFPDPGMVCLDGLASGDPARIICTPYANEVRLRRFLGTENREDTLRSVLRTQWSSLAEKYYSDKTVNLLTAHLFMGRKGELVQEEESEGERSILHPGGLEALFTDDLPQGCQYAALGHLHRGFPLSGGPGPAVYSGSPAAYSLNEKGGQSVVLAEIQPGGKTSFRFEKLQTPWPIYRETFAGTTQAIEWLRDHQEGYVELTIRTKEYIKGSEKQKLLLSHPRILSIIPELEGTAPRKSRPLSSFLSKPVKELFREYYRRNRQDLEPSEELLSLLNEILAGEED